MSDTAEQSLGSANAQPHSGARLTSFSPVSVEADGLRNPLKTLPDRNSCVHTRSGRAATTAEGGGDGRRQVQTENRGNIARQRKESVSRGTAASMLALT